jgi:hypothetical protein
MSLESNDEKPVGQFYSQEKSLSRYSKDFMKLNRKIVIKKKKLEMKRKIKNILNKKLNPVKSELLANNIVEKLRYL